MRAPCVCLCLCLSAAPAAAQDWPLERLDGARTSFQALPALITQPAVSLSIPLGGSTSGGLWMTGDVDLDDRIDVVILRGGRAIARRLDGTVVWASDATELSRVLAIEDWDGDGRVEVLVRSPAGVHVLRGRDGSLRAETGVDGDRVHGGALPVDVDGDGRSELFVSDTSVAGGAGRVFSFPDGLDRPPRVVSIDLSEHGRFWSGQNGHAIGDIDGDGSPELVSLADRHVHVYDLTTGARRLSSPDLDRIPYAFGLVELADVDGDGRDEVLVATDNDEDVPSPKRLLLLELEGGALVVRDQLVFDRERGAHAFVRPLAADLIAGGPLEIVTSFYDPVSDRYDTIVLDGGAGDLQSPIVRLRDRRLLAITDVDGDGDSEILTEDTEGLFAPRFGTVRATAIGAGDPPTARLVFREDDAQVAFESNPWFGQAPVRLGGPAGVVMLRYDLDGDLQADAVGTADEASRRSMPASVFAVAALRFGADILVSRSDGRFAHLSAPDLSLANDTSPADGQPDLLETVHSPGGLAVGPTSAGRALLTVAPGRIAVALSGERLTADGGLERLWQSDLPVDGDVQFLPDGSGRAFFRAQTRRDTLTLRVSDVGADRLLGAYTLGAASETRGGHAPLPLLDARGAVSRLAIELISRRTADNTYVGVDPRDGSSLDLDLGRNTTGFGDRPPTAHDADGDGVQDVFVTQRFVARAASGATGARIVERDLDVIGGVISWIDVDGDGAPEPIQHHGAALRRLDPDDFSPRWAVDAARGFAAFGLHAGGAAIGFRPAARGRFGVVDGADGELLGDVVLASGRAHADEAAALAAGGFLGDLDIVAARGLVRDGDVGFAVASSDGWLYAVAMDGALEWAIEIGSDNGIPIVADLDGDGRSEVLLGAADGNVHVISDAGLDAVGGVYDTDGTFVAAGPEDDVDEVRSSSTVGASWEEVPGATGYEYRLTRDDGAVVVPFVDVGAATDHVQSGLALQRGRRYVTAVRAYAGRGPSRRASVLARSDGFVVVDDAPPLVTIEASPPVFWRGRDDAADRTLITGFASDAVGLDRYRMAIEDEDGESVAELAAASVGGTERTILREWDGTGDDGSAAPAGRYAAVLVAWDGEGSSAEARADVVLCVDGSTEPRCVGGAPPELTLTADPPVFWPDSRSVAARTTLHAVGRDEEALVRFELAVTGGPVLVDEAVSSDRVDVLHEWAGTLDDGSAVEPGDYEVTATVTDPDGLIARARVVVTVCPDEPGFSERCDELVRLWQVRGGCACGAAAPGGGGAAWWLGLAGLASLARRRRRGRSRA